MAFFNGYKEAEIMPFENMVFLLSQIYKTTEAPYVIFKIFKQDVLVAWVDGGLGSCLADTNSGL